MAATVNNPNGGWVAFFEINFDGPVKSHFSRFSVIPAEAGIQ